ncbi:MAG: hydrogenase maturation nickel metallochaperone HypA [Candidatus Mcinerneyibacterium aminivorans]|uniref:Hydrogenase maturation factor HypA n=1 Tax=Candidatus Mcinerneyibacterium aminivorans TaxID=2703815 RepID=A0A5D0MH58_9BACT|nr:MAG: hydrogenase maturation nickel metallochaperone HypA [Candidatus Mcinerneyibacterium aminivorans]
MHEFTAVKNIINIILKAARDNNAEKIYSIKIGIGELTMLEKNQIQYWLKLMLDEIDIAKNSKLNLHIIKGVIRCQECNFKGPLESTMELNHLFPVIKCPECESNNIEIIKGDRCLVEEMEVDKYNESISGGDN